MPDAPISILAAASGGGSPTAPVVILGGASGGGSPTSPVSILSAAAGGGSPTSPVLILSGAAGGGSPASPVSILATAGSSGAIPETLTASGLLSGATEIGAGEYTRWTDAHSRPRWYRDDGLIRYWFGWDDGENAYAWIKGQESVEGAGDWETQSAYLLFMAVVNGTMDPWLAEAWYVNEGYSGTPSVIASGVVTAPAAILSEASAGGSPSSPTGILASAGGTAANTVQLAGSLTDDGSPVTFPDLTYAGEVAANQFAWTSDGTWPRPASGTFYEILVARSSQIATARKYVNATIAATWNNTAIGPDRTDPDGVIFTPASSGANGAGGSATATLVTFPESPASVLS